MDIVTHCNVPRYLHVDVPLGNPLGPPWQHEQQRRTLISALQMAAEASEPEVRLSDITWPGDPDWRAVYNRVDASNREALLQMGEENRRQRAENKAAGLSR